MIEKFQLDPVFADPDFKIGELNLTYLLLNNNALFPWVILVPKRNNIREIIDLTQIDQHLLIDEINLVSLAIKKLFLPDKLNIATLGNITPQLHIHIIARYKTDKAWPQAVFGKEKQEYYFIKRQEILTKLQTNLIISETS